MPDSHLILASSSPRRAQLLQAVGIPFRIQPADVDETRLRGESAEDMVLRLAAAKAMAVSSTGPDIVIAADTAVALDNEIFGKPRCEADAVRMLSLLSGRTHRVVTGVAVRRGESMTSALSSTDVSFRDIDPDEARRYWHSGEPQDKAGAYAIQGRGGAFVRAIMGSYSGVVGLPIFETAELLRKAGIDPLAEIQS